MSPQQYWELPLDSPSSTTIGFGAGYCTVFDVQAMNFARSIGVGSNPGASQVNIYIQMVAGQINSVLTRLGYQTPVNSASYPVAGALLNSINATGAWWMMESAAPNSLNLDRAKAAFDAAMVMLEDGKYALDVPLNVDRSEPRGPWQTLTPTGNIYDPTTAGINNRGNGIVGNDGFSNPADPYFSRSMEF